MVKSIEQMANELTLKLNANCEKLNEIYKNVNFEFNIFSDTGDYKPSVRNGNTLIYFINGIMTVIGSTNEGEDINATDSSVTTMVELLIPSVDGSNKRKTIAIFNTARNIIDDTLSLNVSNSETINDIEYFVSSHHKIASTGIRDIRPKVGDSLTLAVGITYNFVALGVSSKNIGITVDGEKINYTHLGFNRRTLVEGNVLSIQDEDIDVPSAAGAVSGTNLVINMAMPTRKTSFDKKAIGYLTSSLVPEMDVDIEIPVKGGITSRTFKMIFSSVAINGQLGCNASTEVELVENI